MRAEPGFSLIETMVAAAMLGLVTAAFVTTVSYAATSAARTRLQATAAADAFAQLERFVAIARVTRDDDERCALLKSPGAPLDVGSGGVLEGSCPLLTARDVPVDGGLRRTTMLTAVADDGRPAWRLQIEERADTLREAVVVVTMVPR